MDIKDLKLLIKTITETDISEFKIENAEEKIIIRRGPKTEYVSMAPQAPLYTSIAPSASAPINAPITAQTTSAPLLPAGDIITSPIVGTFYRAPAPDASPYVEVGQIVEKGETLCIVEAMKLMNEIEAEYRCKIVQICKENAQAVEFGDSLFIVERA